MNRSEAKKQLHSYGFIGENEILTLQTGALSNLNNVTVSFHDKHPLWHQLTNVIRISSSWTNGFGSMGRNTEPLSLKKLTPKELTEAIRNVYPEIDKIIRNNKLNELLDESE